MSQTRAVDVHQSLTLTNPDCMKLPSKPAQVSRNSYYDISLCSARNVYEWIRKLINFHTLIATKYKRVKSLSLPAQLYMALSISTVCSLSAKNK
jgi:hypothetical protein